MIFFFYVLLHFRFSASIFERSDIQPLRFIFLCQIACDKAFLLFYFSFPVFFFKCFIFVRWTMDGHRPRLVIISWCVTCALCYMWRMTLCECDNPHCFFSSSRRRRSFYFSHFVLPICYCCRWNGARFFFCRFDRFVVCDHCQKEKCQY